MLERADNWPEILSGVIEGARERPFCFGTHDCALFAADAVLAMTGTDLAARYRGTYSDERGALRLMGERGALHAMACEALGEPIDPALALRGDVVLTAQQGRYSLGVCVGRQFASPGKAGLLFFSMGRADCAWRV